MVLQLLFVFMAKSSVRCECEQVHCLTTSPDRFLTEHCVTCNVNQSMCSETESSYADKIYISRAHSLAPMRPLCSGGERASVYLYFYFKRSCYLQMYAKTNKKLSIFNDTFFYATCLLLFRIASDWESLHVCRFNALMTHDAAVHFRSKRMRLHHSRLH